MALIVNHQHFRRLNIGRYFTYYVAHVAYLDLSGGTTLRPFCNSVCFSACGVAHLRLEEVINYRCVSPFAMVGFTIAEELLWLISAREEVLTSPITAIIVKSSCKIEVCYTSKMMIGDLPF